MAKPIPFCDDCRRMIESFGLEQQQKPPPPDLPEFKYDALPDKRKSMRLLNLFSSSPDNPQIECELEVVGMEPAEIDKHTDGEGYEALSWCWGTAPPDSSINIRKGRFKFCKKVQPDLFAALKALRSPRQDRYLWIDAICIDQHNVGEKNHQVEMMSAIYGRAKSVCVWLGEGDASSAMAIKFIKDEVLQLQNFDELCDSKEASKKWGALLELMQRKWFSRRWVVQEIALARTATIYCGTDFIPWKDFAVAVELFVEVETATHRLSEVMKKDPQFYHVPGWFEYVSALGASLLVSATGMLFRDTKFIGPAPSNSTKEERPERQPLLTLEYLVSSLSIFDVTMEHDTVYALLAIAKDTVPSASDTQLSREETPRPPESSLAPPTRPVPLKPYTPKSDLKLDRTKSALEDFTQRKRYTVAYESPYVDTCKTFIQFCISHSDRTRALDIICRPWASEYKAGGEQNFFYENRPQAPKEQTMPLPSWVSQLSGAPFALYAHAGINTLKMGRKNADSLVGMPNVLQRNYAAAETRGCDLKSLRFRKRVAHHMHFSMYVEGFVLDTVENVFPASQGGAIPREWVDAVNWNDVERDEPPDAFWRTLVADRGRDPGRNPPVYYSRACQESFGKGGLASGSVSTSDLINNERCSVVAQFCRRVQAVIWNRSLIKTVSQRLGIVSKNVSHGDLVCILYGCSVPVILRKCKKKKTLTELAREREEDFENTLKQYQLKWKRRFERNRRVRSELNELRMHKKATLPAERPAPTQDPPPQRESSSGSDPSENSKGEESEPKDPQQETKQDKGKGKMTPLEEHLENESLKSKEQVAGEWEERFKGWLKEKPEDECDDRYFYYEFLGEAYIHGMMDGEAIEYQNNHKPPIKTQLFELR